MSGARRMQEFRYCREGAALVISLEGLNWIYTRRCKDKRPKKRNEELPMLMPSGQMVQADDKLQPITCLYVLNQKRCMASHVQRKKSNFKSSLKTWPPPLPTLPCCCLTIDPTHHLSTCTSFACFMSECPTEAPWTRLIIDIKDMFTWITKSLNAMTQKDFFELLNRFIIFFDEDKPQELFRDIYCTKDYRVSIEDAQWHLSDYTTRTSTANQLHNPDANSKYTVDTQHEDLQNSLSLYGASEVLAVRNTKRKKRKSVSFADDVVVYLFNQESPTVELQAEACTALPSNLPDVMMEDIGLEWEDDFSALERNCHFQHVQLSQLKDFSQSCPAVSRLERFSVSQTCLFLTHVTEADLEL